MTMKYIRRDHLNMKDIMSQKIVPMAGFEPPDCEPHAYFMHAPTAELCWLTADNRLLTLVIPCILMRWCNEQQYKNSPHVNVVPVRARCPFKRTVTFQQLPIYHEFTYGCDKVPFNTQIIA